MSTPLEVFCCYAREDQEMLMHLKKYLTPLQRQGQITIWSDTNLNAGAEWERELHQHLESADLILLLVSPDFISSDYCYSTEMKRAIERHNQGNARLIPILLRPTIWRDTPFAHLQIVPKDARPITSWPDIDEAYNDVTERISLVVSEIRTLLPNGNGAVFDPAHKRIPLKWAIPLFILVALLIGSINLLAYAYITRQNPTVKVDATATAKVDTTAPSLVTAATHPDGSLWFYSHTIGLVTWKSEQVAGPGSAVGTPSIVQIADTTAIVVVRSDGSLYYYWKTPGTATWKSEQVAGSDSAIKAASAAQVANTLVIVARDSVGKLYYYWQTPNETTWNQILVSGQGSAVGTPSVAQVTDAPTIVAVHSNGSLWFYWRDEPTGTAIWHPEEIAGPDSAIKAASVARVANTIEIVAAHFDGSLSYYWAIIYSPTWNPEQVAGPGSVVGIPSIALVPDTTAIVVIYSDGSLYYYWKTPGTATWKSEQIT